MKPLLVVALGRTIADAPLGRRADDVEVRRVPTLPTAVSLDPDRPTVILVDRILVQSSGMARDALEALGARAALVGVGDPGEVEPPEVLPADLLCGYLPADAPAATLMVLLRGALRHAHLLVSERGARAEEQRRHTELQELTRIGVALSTERDLGRLLEQILTQARQLTSSDAGSIYLAERNDDGPPRELRFRLAQNHTIPNLPLREFTVPVDHSSLAGYAAATGDPLVIADVYLLPEGVTYRQNRSFDERFGYRTRSMLVIPMKSHRDEVVGVLQLINRKRDGATRLDSDEVSAREVLPFDDRAVELVTALASQAAVAIENSRLYEEIERLFEGFVTAAVTAIESRDPATSGHSSRVATLSVGLAEAVDRGGEGAYRDVRFSREQLRELRYAGLLHDFGKVGVREQVLVKQKKLYPHDLEIIRHRFAARLQATELEFERGRAAHLLRYGSEGLEEAMQSLADARDRRRAELGDFLDVIVQANEPTVLAEEGAERLEAMRGETYLDLDGTERPLLRDDELQFLMIRRGNLDDRERREIESHVTHTYRFLERIPWTRELRGVPQIAYAHHEKLDGRGYPRAIRGEDIPVQTRMMTIADIYDALTAADRPYKRAVAVDRALDILAMEARDGMLDAMLLQCFVEARVYEQVAGGPA